VIALPHDTTYAKDVPYKAMFSLGTQQIGEAYIQANGGTTTTYRFATGQELQIKGFIENALITELSLGNPSTGM